MSRLPPLPARAALLLAAFLASPVLGCEGHTEVLTDSTTSSGTSTGSDTSTSSATSTSSGEDPPLCGSGKATTLLADGAYFFLLELTKPIETQLQLFGDVRIEPSTGAVLAQLTNANRNPAPDLCPFPCDATEVCRLLPEPECVPPSKTADSPDEYSDFVVAPDAPQGYTFTVEGCVEDPGDGSALLTTLPATLTISQPSVALIDLTITCKFTPGADGALRCTGTTTAPEIKLGSLDAGPAEGSVTGRALPPGEAPAGLPAPPE